VGAKKEDEHGRLGVITVIPGCIGLIKIPQERARIYTEIDIS
jgi:hypothetical protein